MKAAAKRAGGKAKALARKVVVKKAKLAAAAAGAAAVAVAASIAVARARAEEAPVAQLGRQGSDRVDQKCV